MTIFHKKFCPIFTPIKYGPNINMLITYFMIELSYKKEYYPDIGLHLFDRLVC